MNGVMEIKVGSVKHSLKFGMLAIELLGQQQVLNPSQASIKMLMDLVYAGMSNAAIIEGKQAKSYAEVSEIVEELLEQQDEQPELIWECFSKSKAGEKLLTGLKKKQEENQSQSL